jgi:predicted nucleic acid-binding protein
MTSPFLYLDTSALVKLILPEAESEALAEFLSDWDDPVSSTLAVIEIHRATRRATLNEAVHRRAAEVIEGIHLLEIDDGILASASSLPPVTLRSLDAIHLASALALEPDLGALVSYDIRLTEAAERQEIETHAPR